MSQPIRVVNGTGVSGPDRNKEIPPPPGWSESSFNGLVNHYAEVYGVEVRG